MSISPICFYCGKELMDFGAIIITPPKYGEKKRHQCLECFEEAEQTAEQSKSVSKRLRIQRGKV